MPLNTARRAFGREPHTIIGIELDECRLDYGVAPCTANGSVKCFRSRETCQDPANYDASFAPAAGPISEPMLKDAGVGGLHLRPVGTVDQTFTGTHPFTIWFARVYGDGYLEGYHRSLETTGAFTFSTAAVPNDTTGGPRVVAGYGNPATFQWYWCVYIEAGKVYYAHTDQFGILRSQDHGTTATGEQKYRLHRLADGRTHILYKGFNGTTTLGLKSTASPPAELGTIADARLIIGYDFDGYFKGINFWDKEVPSTKTLQAAEAISAGRSSCSDEIACYPFQAESQGQTKKWFRFYLPSSNAPYLDSGFPCLESVKLNPTRLDPDKGLGRRSRITATLTDFPFHDRGVDPYVDERAYDVEDQGTFLARLFARHRTSLQGRRLVVLTGYLAEDGGFNLQNYDRRTYEIERVDFDSAGRVTLTAKDPLKRADESKALAPRASKGELTADITDTDTTIVVASDELETEYPTGAFKIRIGKEVLEVTRPASNTPNWTVVTRGAHGTEAEEHSQGDTVQICLEYSAQSPSDIIYDLLVEYAETPPAYIDKPSWDAETAAFISRLYSALITEPTAVNTLISEMIQQGPCAIWWDERRTEIPFRALRPPETNVPPLDDAENILADSVKVKELHDDRVSTAVIFMGRVDPTVGLKEARNYSTLYVESDLDLEAASHYGQPAIQTIHSRWITAPNKGAGIALVKNIIARYGKSPREVEFALDAKDSDIWVGDLVPIKTRALPTPDGSVQPLLIQIIEAHDAENGHRFEYVGREYKVSDFVSADIYASGKNDSGYDIRREYELVHGPVTGPVSFRLIIEPGTIIGSPGSDTPALSTGIWPAGTEITVICAGRIQGYGGNGGAGSASSGLGPFGQNGEDGSTAIKADYPITFEADSGFPASSAPQIWGGGGGGGGGDDGGALDNDGGGGGGGGAGCSPGEAGATYGGLAYPGTTESGGNGGGNGGSDAGDGGNGGDPGQPGVDGGIGNFNAGHRGFGGAAGKAIDGQANVTFAPGVTADIRGPVI